MKEKKACTSRNDFDRERQGKKRDQEPERGVGNCEIKTELVTQRYFPLIHQHAVAHIFDGHNPVCFLVHFFPEQADVHINGPGFDMRGIVIFPNLGQQVFA